jgi:hypothetical protein
MVNALDDLQYETIQEIVADVFAERVADTG